MSPPLELLRRRVDAALAEVGYGGHVRPPGPNSPPGTRFVITRGAVPLELTWKALALITIQQRGAAAPVKCPRHARCQPEDAVCPRYPVGALLAGTITGCSQ